MLKNQNQKLVNSICAKFISIMKVLKADPTYELVNPTYKFRDPRHISGEEEIVFHHRQNLRRRSHILYTCIEPTIFELSTETVHNYKSTFKIATVSTNIVVLFLYKEDQNGYAPVAARKEDLLSPLSSEVKNIPAETEFDYDLFADQKEDNNCTKCLSALTVFCDTACNFLNTLEKNSYPPPGVYRRPH